MDPDINKLKVIDPLSPQEVVDFDAQKGCSPFDPPDAYTQPIADESAIADMDPYLREFVSEHADFKARLDTFEAVVTSIRKKTSIDAASFAEARSFFDYFDTDVVPHNRREERQLFPLLRQRMLERGEHSAGANPITPIAVLEKEHIDAIQVGAVAVSFLALAFRLEHEASTQMVLSIALERCETLIEMLRLHIFREDKIVFALAQDFLTADELAAMKSL